VENAKRRLRRLNMVSVIDLVPLLIDIGLPAQDAFTPVFKRTAEMDTLSLTVAAAYKILGGRPDYLATVSKMLRRHPRHHHLLITYPAFTEPIAADVADRLHMIGPVPHAELGYYYSLADIYIESWPLISVTTRYEALSFSLPLITFDDGSHSQDVELMGGCNPTTDEKQLAARLDVLIKGGGFRALASASSHAWFKKNLDRLLVAARILEVVEIAGRFIRPLNNEENICL
jgi:glycosyltransferase involved in cell wall biosynthesis